MKRLVGLALVALCGAAEGQVVAYSFSGEGEDGNAFSWSFTVDVDASSIFVDNSDIGVIIYNPAVQSVSYNVAGISFSTNDAPTLSGLLSINDNVDDPNLADAFALTLGAAGAPIGAVNMVIATGAPGSSLTTSLDFPTSLNIGLADEASVSFDIVGAGLYRGTITGADVRIIPAPTTAGLLAMGGLVAARRRR